MTTPSSSTRRRPRVTAPEAGAHGPIVPAEVADGRCRVVLEAAAPEVDAGRFPAKRAVGDVLRLEVDAFGDGHDGVVVVARVRPDGSDTWQEQRLESVGNDRWHGEYALEQPGRVWFTFVAWVDHWGTWRRDLRARVTAGQDVAVDLRIGAALVRAAAGRAGERDARALELAATQLEEGGPAGVVAALDDELDACMRSFPDRTFESTYLRELAVDVERRRAAYGAWYERFPRSAAPAPGRHGTLLDLQQELPSIAAMGFDVLYLPPIHPIGRDHRKGPNNNVVAGPDDPGSPWAIGSAEGGHTEIHPELGTLDDFEQLRAAAAEHGLELALDLAYQCAPDHPWVTEHPTWFRARPDGKIQYAENPPKKYQDIYPIDFETPDWEELWHGLKGVVDTWVQRGVRIFRVDNPHTKAFPFWEWMIAEVRRASPDVIFLAEAFTRPKVMHRLAKLGFSQSYTYFTWRQGKDELEEYVRELTSAPVADFFRPAFWPNTPDILTEQLQNGSRGTFVSRLVLAAGLAATWGMYGPAFELMENEPARPGSEEYLDSEKYQVRHRPVPSPRAPGEAPSLAEVIAIVNRARRDHPALQRNDTTVLHGVQNDALMAWSKRSLDGSDTVLMVVTLDPEWRQGGHLELDLDALGIAEDQAYEVHDLLGGATYRWQGRHPYVELDPAVLPAHILHVRPLAPSLQDSPA